ncbi:MAG TPA: hypothetical protein VGS12_09730 [Caulobacteraceae bacterium]|nr:hypothetical protein [Caulobacteraceae bacterium]
MIFSAVPLMVLPVLAYNLFALTLPGGFGSAAAASALYRPLTSLRTAAGGVWPISLADVMLAFSLLVFFVELVKASGEPRAAIVNHGLSIVLFAACLAEMLAAPAFANSVFFLITLMTLLDVVAGLVLTMAARRDRGRGDED